MTITFTSNIYMFIENTVPIYIENVLKLFLSIYSFISFFFFFLFLTTYLLNKTILI